MLSLCYLYFKFKMKKIEKSINFLWQFLDGFYSNGSLMNLGQVFIYFILTIIFLEQ